MDEEEEEGREHACLPESQQRVQFLEKEATKGNFFNEADENDAVDPDIGGESKMKLCSLKNVRIQICKKVVEDGEAHPEDTFFRGGGKLEIAPRILLFDIVEVAKNRDNPQEQFGEPNEVG